MFRKKWMVVIPQRARVMSAFVLKNSFTFPENTCQRLKLSEFQESWVRNRKSGDNIMFGSTTEMT